MLNAISFETERLVIRLWNEADAFDALELYNHPDVLRWLPTRKPTTTAGEQWENLKRVNDTYAALNDGTGFWAIVEKESWRPIGSVIAKKLPGHEETEIGWHLNPNYWGRGYATEAGRWAAEYCFNDLGLNRIVAVVLPHNARSIAVTQRLGMRFESIVTAYDLELNLYALDKAEGVRKA